ncbi:hypothetical protein D1007_45478 [Hordeum vulgare]|nr:hypothetical protein D1007_45478 [Hordeum vulgare]
MQRVKVGSNIGESCERAKDEREMMAGRQAERERCGAISCSAVAWVKVEAQARPLLVVEVVVVLLNGFSSLRFHHSLSLLYFVHYVRPSLEELHFPPQVSRIPSDDRRPSVDRRLDRRRRSWSRSTSRSRSRSRTRPRNSYSGSRRNSDWRPRGGDFDQPRSGDLDQSKVPAESRTTAGRDGEVDRDDVDKLPRDPKILHSKVVMVEDGASHEDEDAVEPEHDGARPEDEDAEYEYEEVVESDEHGEDDDGVTYEYEEMETEDNGQDDEAAAVAGLNDADAVEINASHQLPMVDVHPSEPAEEPVHTQS